MFKKLIFIWCFLVCLKLANAGIDPSNKFTLGDGTATNKTFEFKKSTNSATNPKIRWNNATSELQFANDGSTFSAFGTGGGSTTYLWKGLHATDCNFSRTSTALGDPNIDSSCTFTQQLNVGFGTVTSYNDGTPGNNRPGIVFTPPAIGYYNVCASFQGTENASATMTFELWDLVPTITATGMALFGNGAGSFFSLCGIYYVNAITSRTLRIVSAIGGGGNTVVIQEGGGVSSAAIRWEIDYIGP